MSPIAVKGKAKKRETSSFWPCRGSSAMETDHVADRRVEDPQLSAAASLTVSPARRTPPRAPHARKRATNTKQKEAGKTKNKEEKTSPT
eukprot:1588068-Rhodomonas_salina.1